MPRDKRHCVAFVLVGTTQAPPPFTELGRSLDKAPKFRTGGPGDTAPSPGSIFGGRRGG